LSFLERRVDYPPWNLYGTNRAKHLDFSDRALNYR